ncbi:unnamed protein product [Paramecium primaurelia]|uniref:Uncharacterized protein n=1 Tax=Paramecium primaurelia TaxID=5886 RepID=A0A8S1M0H2_PARPR|nr:unnamed protein product [Paramecium primaurelia]
MFTILLVNSFQQKTLYSLQFQQQGFIFSINLFYINFSCCSQICCRTRKQLVFINITLDYNCSSLYQNLLFLHQEYIRSLFQQVLYPNFKLFIHNFEQDFIKFNIYKKVIKLFAKIDLKNKRLKIFINKLRQHLLVVSKSQLQNHRKILSSKIQKTKSWVSEQGYFFKIDTE